MLLRTTAATWWLFMKTATQWLVTTCGTTLMTRVLRYIAYAMRRDVRGATCEHPLKGSCPTKRSGGGDIRILSRSAQYLVVDKPADMKINSDTATDVTVATELCRTHPELVDSRVRFGFRSVQRGINANGSVSNQNCLHQTYNLFREFQCHSIL